MADKKEEEKEKKQGKPKGKGIGLKGRVFLAVFILLGLIFLPTSFMVFVGMVPSMIALLFSGRGGPRASTVSAMNLAGCIPFVFKLWSSGNDFESSVDILLDSQTLMVIYTAAAFGWMIDWVVAGLVSSYYYQKGMARMGAIKKRQKALIDQWGREVAGGLAGDDTSEDESVTQ